MSLFCALTALKIWTFSVWNELLNNWRSKLQRNYTGHISCYLWHLCLKIYNLKRINAKMFLWEQPYSFDWGTRNSGIMSFIQTTWAKVVYQKTFMGGDHIWYQSLFLLWTFLFHDYSALPVNLMVHMFFSL